MESPEEDILPRGENEQAGVLDCFTREQWLLQEAPLFSAFPLPACKMDTQVPDVVATGQPLGWEPHTKEAKEAGLW